MDRDRIIASDRSIPLDETDKVFPSLRKFIPSSQANHSIGDRTTVAIAF